MSLLFLAVAGDAFAQKRHKSKKKQVETTMTVIHVGDAKDGFLTVSFTPSQRIYRIPAKAKPEYLELLRSSEKNHTPVTIRRESEQSDIIQSVRKGKGK